MKRLCELGLGSVRGGEVGIDLFDAGGNRDAFELTWRSSVVRGGSSNGYGRRQFERIGQKIKTSEGRKD